MKKIESSDGKNQAYIHQMQEVAHSYEVSWFN